MFREPQSLPEQNTRLRLRGSSDRWLRSAPQDVVKMFFHPRPDRKLLDAGNQPGRASIGWQRRRVLACQWPPSNPAGSSLKTPRSGRFFPVRARSRSSLSTLSARTETAREGGGGESSAGLTRAPMTERAADRCARIAVAVAEQNSERGHLRQGSEKAKSPLRSGLFVGVKAAWPATRSRCRR
jgi:hypothetical protein